MFILELFRYLFLLCKGVTVSPKCACNANFYVLLTGIYRFPFLSMELAKIGNKGIIAVGKNCKLLKDLSVRFCDR